MLVVRCCRAPQFDAAVAWTRAALPGARVWAFTSPAGVDTAWRAGVDHLLVQDDDFGATRLSLAMYRTLRGLGLTHVVIPQMATDGALYANIYRMVAALGVPEVVVLAPGTAPKRVPLRTFARDACRASLGGLVRALDVPLMLLALIAALARPRRTPGRATAGRGRRRILHVISTLGVGGSQVQLATLVARLPRDRYDVHVLALGGADDEFSRAHFRRPDITLHQVRAGTSRIGAILAVRDLCRTHRFDIVHTWLFLSNVIGAAGARLAGTPRIISAVRNLSHAHRTYDWEWWKRPADALATRAADLVTVSARPLLADHARWTWCRPSSLAVVHSGLDPADLVFDRDACRMALRAELHVSGRQVVIGTVGRLAHEKDQETLLRAVSRLRIDGHDIVTVVVGDGDRRAALESLAQRLGLGTAVRFLGTRRDARRIIAGLDLFVLSSAVEGLPNALLEAALLGIPAVATDVGGCRDVIVDESVLVPAANPVKLAEAIARRLADPLRRRRDGAALRARALTMFTADHMVNAWLALYGDRALEARAPEPASTAA